VAIQGEFDNTIWDIADIANRREMSDSQGVRGLRLLRMAVKVRRGVLVVVVSLRCGVCDCGRFAPVMTMWMEVCAGAVQRESEKKRDDDTGTK